MYYEGYGYDDSSDICRYCSSPVSDTLYEAGMCEECVVRFEGGSGASEEREKNQRHLKRITPEEFKEHKFPPFTSVREDLRVVWGSAYDKQVICVHIQKLLVHDGILTLKRAKSISIKCSVA